MIQLEHCKAAGTNNFGQNFIPMTRLPVIVVCILIAVSSIGQSNYKQSSLSLSAQLQEFKFLDIHASPLLYKTSLSPCLTLSYAHQSKRSIFSTSLTGSTGNANPERFGSRFYSPGNNASEDSFTLSSGFVSVQFETAYLRKFRKSKNENLSYWLGAQLKETAFYADEVADFPWLMNDISLSPLFKAIYYQKKNTIDVELGASVLSAVSREIYALFPKSATDNNVISFFKQGTGICSINKFQHLHFKANYFYSVSKRIEAGATYSLQWMHCNYPKRIQATDAHIGLAIKYIF
ncbi:MAG: hypothetical protein JSU05_02990 [Bacteroidetes bacterium]|nr:hypothetical protein [Bacteroidota bacterium]